MITHAVYQGRLHSVEEFTAKYGAHALKRGVVPACPSCGEDVHTYAAHSPGVSSCYHHHKENPACPLSRSPDNRGRHLIPAGWDIEGGKRLKEEFCRDANLKEAYAVAHKLCRKLAGTEFVAFCRAADRLNIWSYKDLPLQYVPYILATLDDLPAAKERRAQAFRFVLHKPERGPIDIVWQRPLQCSLVKVFADSGRPFIKGTVSIPWDEAELARGDTSWISDALFQIIRQCRNRHY